MASSFFSDFGLMWYLGELSKKEFMKFKELLKEETLERGLKQIPWIEVKKASREDLANLLIKHYEEQQAWDMTLSIFCEIGRNDLCEKAVRESTGHTKMYQAHIKEKFLTLWGKESITKLQDFFDYRVTPEERDYLDRLFISKMTGEEVRTVFLQGQSGVGKTTLLIKLMLAWSEGGIFQDKFAYIFYFCCREIRHLAATSLAELISRAWPNSSTTLENIVSQPEKLLFVIDSFEELKCDLNEPESELCPDCMEKLPTKVLLSSLLKRKMLPEAFLLISTTPEHPQELEDKLGCLEIKFLKGFNESMRKLYFCNLFQDRNRGLEAFGFVRDNVQLFSLCGIPMLCWIACTCLKQEMERGRDLGPTCRRTTSLYAAFIFNLFTPKGARCPNRQSQGQLQSLCSLAAEGMWTDTFTFSQEALRRNGIMDSNIPALLDKKVLVRSRESPDSYAFLHVSLLEFCAAMFYFVKSHRDHPNPAVGGITALLKTFLKKVNPRWIFLGCFIFGLLHENEQQKLGAFFGFQLAHEVKEECQQCLEGLGGHDDLEGEQYAMRLFYCLFEMQDEVFVEQAMDLMREVKLDITDISDLLVSAYCLKRCSGLQKFWLSVQNVFTEEKALTFELNHNLVWWHQICSVLTRNEHLQELRVKDCCLSGSAYITLCNQLKQPNCFLQILQIKDVTFYGESWFFFDMFISNPNLKHLELNHIDLSRDDVTLLCNALNHPTCNIEKLVVVGCGLSSEDCDGFASVLMGSKKLKHLNLTYNKLDEGLPMLCTALGRPDCSLVSLVMAYCSLNEHCCQYLSEVLLSNKTLRCLDLSANALRDEGLKILCEALRHPDCLLESLCLLKCSFTAGGCQDLVSVLTNNQHVRNLRIGGNEIKDAGVKLLCKALIHPECRLRNLGLEACELTSACCEDLCSVFTRSKTLWGLDLSQNPLDHSGVVKLCETLRLPGCALHVLGLRISDFDEETQALLIAEEERNPNLAIIDR